MKFATCMAIVFASAVSAQAAQPVAVNSLNAVGLSNVVALSDVEGTQIRAKYRNRSSNVITAGTSTVNSSAEQRGGATNGATTNSASARGRFDASQGNLSGSLSAATGGSGRTSAAGTISGGSSFASGR